MITHAATPHRWTTAAFSDAADTMPGDLKALGAHVKSCNGGRERWFALHCAVESIHGFVAPRIVTTLVVATLLIGAGALVL